MGPNSRHFSFCDSFILRGFEANLETSPYIATFHDGLNEHLGDSCAMSGGCQSTSRFSNPEVVIPRHEVWTKGLQVILLHVGDLKTSVTSE